MVKWVSRLLLLALRCNKHAGYDTQQLSTAQEAGTVLLGTCCAGPCGASMQVLQGTLQRWGSIAVVNEGVSTT